MPISDEDCLDAIHEVGEVNNSVSVVNNLTIASLERASVPGSSLATKDLTSKHSQFRRSELMKRDDWNE